MAVRTSSLKCRRAKDVLLVHHGGPVLAAQGDPTHGDAPDQQGDQAADEPFSGCMDVDFTLLQRRTGFRAHEDIAPIQLDTTP